MKKKLVALSLAIVLLISFGVVSFAVEPGSTDLYINSKLYGEGVTVNKGDFAYFYGKTDLLPAEAVGNEGGLKTVDLKLPKDIFEKPIVNYSSSDLYFDIITSEYDYSLGKDVWVVKFFTVASGVEYINVRARAYKSTSQTKVELETTNGITVTAPAWITVK